jgi:hypothetical protein
VSHTYRPVSSVVIFVLAAVVAAYMLADAIVRDTGHGLRALPIVALVAWGLWIVMVHPAIHSDEAGLRITNPGRVTLVPWSRVSGIRRRLQLIVTLDDGRDLTCWGSPYVKRGGTESEDLAVIELNAAWESGRLAAASSGAPRIARIARRWDVISLGVGAVLAVASVIAALV